MHKYQTLQYVHLPHLPPSLKGFEVPEPHDSFAVPTCYKHDQGAERLSPGCCPAWCYDRGSGPSAAPLLAAAKSATAVEAASQTVAGMLQGVIKTDILIWHMGYLCN